MVCVQCGGQTRVINSRHQRRANQVWRRRQCRNPQCGAVFTSEETAAYNAAWAVQGPSGKLAPFSRDKLLLSLYKSLEHRSTAVADAGGLADTVIKRLSGAVTDGVIESQAIVHAAQVALNRFDKAASTHYSAFHPKHN
ncbi:MAG TPA: hypothetical protein VFH99_04115 [Candidatus Saccharimonadales bacterium]|nr:hypothetical protein [Candidatus Saccharimonadales bacterium]